MALKKEGGPMTALQRLQQGRYIGPVWIGIHGVPREREHRIIISVDGVRHLGPSESNAAFVPAAGQRLREGQC